jgi:trimeric autotransporter adhesin
VANNIGVTVTALPLTGAQAVDYTVTFPTGLTANITQASLTVTGIGAQNKPYDGNKTATLTGLNGAILHGVYNGDTVTLNTGGATGMFATQNAGTGITVQVSGLTLGGAQSFDYSVVQPTTAADITQVTLNVTADNKTKTQGATNPTLTYTISGFVNSENSSVVSGSATLTTSASTTSAVGTYSITFNTQGLTATNYTFNYVPGTLTVTPAVVSAATVKPAFQNRDFGSSANPVTLATFQDKAGTTNTYTYTINWNDGSAVDSGSVSVASDGTIVVKGHHVYATDGAKHPTVTVKANNNNSLVASATPTVDVSKDISNKVQAGSSGLTYNKKAGTYSGTITVKNTSGAALTTTGNFRLVLAGLDSRINVTAKLGTTTLTVGRTASGDLYITVPKTSLAKGASFVVNLVFTPPTGVAIKYATKTYEDEY